MTATISKGTLNLRFMQNAQDAQNLANESIESHIQDDSRWEVAKEVRDAWGMGPEPPSSLAVIHEASYLPFVFSGCNDTSGSPQQAVKPRGRRTWNKRGQEVTEGELPSHDDSRGSPSARQVPMEEERHHHNHNASKRLTSISSFGPRSSSTKEIERAKPRNTKSAREIIREDVVAGGGIKIRNVETEEEDKSSGDCSPPSRSAPPPPPPSAPSPHGAASSLSTSNRDKFLKPAGVDEPSDLVSRGDGSRPARPEGDTTRGTGRPKLKRDRDDRRREGAGAQTTNGKRRKGGPAAAT